MVITDPPLLSMLRTRMQWHQERRGSCRKTSPIPIGPIRPRDLRCCSSTGRRHRWHHRALRGGDIASSEATSRSAGRDSRCSLRAWCSPRSRQQDRASAGLVGRFAQAEVSTIPPLAGLKRLISSQALANFAKGLIKLR